MSERIDRDQPASIADLLGAIARWHRTEVSLTDPIPLLAKEVREIKDVVMQQMLAQSGEVETFRKKVAAIEE